MPKSTSKDYKIPSLDRILRLYEREPKPKVCKNRLGQWVNEFFLIEALLRSEKAKQVYRSGDEPGLLRFFSEHHVIDQKPLNRSHHSLLTAPPEKLIWEFKELGDIDSLHGIQDLKVIARLTPDTIITRGNTTVRGYDGEQAILNLLRNPSPRFVCLRLDVSHSAETILKSKKLKRLLQERHKQSESLQPPIVRLLRRSASGVGSPEILSQGPLFAFSNRQRAWTPFKDISTWIRYLKCYDMRADGYRPEEIKEKVFPRTGTALSQYYSAIKQVDRAIESAEKGTWPPSKSRRLTSPLVSPGLPLTHRSF